jgi:hypothetical protein
MKEGEMNEGMNNALGYKVSIGRANIILTSNRSRWKVNNHFDLKDTEYECVDWFKSDQNRYQWVDFMTILMIYGVS